MRSRLLLLFSACLYYSGLVALARRWLLRGERRLIILNYHRADGGELRRHLLYLRRHFRILPLETALDELYAPSQSYNPDKRPPIVLTFDDGYQDNYTYAMPLACAFQAPMTVFLIAGYIGSGNCFWWEDRLIRHAQVREVMFEDHLYHLERAQERKELAKVIDAHIDRAASPAERAAFLASMRRLLAVPTDLTLDCEARPLLTLAEIEKMEASGWITFGAHTQYHPVLSRLRDAAEVRCEVGACRDALERRLGHPVRSFAYPYGKREHIGDEACRAVEQAGYDWALTTISGSNTTRSNPYLLRRVFCDTRQHWLIVAAKTSGLWGPLARLTGLLKQR
jgi:peptidoglycan/xylan/chitin deacetylase (PgdA/CDA1 family)